jgi:hypothetical protein
MRSSRLGLGAAVTSAALPPTVAGEKGVTGKKVSVTGKKVSVTGKKVSGTFSMDSVAAGKKGVRNLFNGQRRGKKVSGEKGVRNPFSGQRPGPRRRR